MKARCMFLRHFCMIAQQLPNNSKSEPWKSVQNMIFLKILKALTNSKQICTTTMFPKRQHLMERDSTIEGKNSFFLVCSNTAHY